MKIELTINDKPQTLSVEPGATLLDTLRSAGYMGVKRGCETGTCGSCVVLMDGCPHYSCLMFAASAEGRHLTTIEALDHVGTGDDPHPIIRAFAEEAGVQCGYCVPGMALTSLSLLRCNPQPKEAEVREALDGHLCRCTGYVKQVKAVLRAAELMAPKGEEVR